MTDTRAWTQADLEQLPEWPSGFGVEDRIVEGVVTRCAVPPRMVVFADVAHVIDATGCHWTIGTHEGTRYKCKRW